jgi:hypothetical protein
MMGVQGSKAATTLPTLPIAFTAEQREQLRDVCGQLHERRRGPFIATVRGQLASVRQPDGSVSNQQFAAAINVGMRQQLQAWMSR